MYNPIDTEASLLAGLAQGNRKATEAIYKQHIRPIKSWIGQHGGDEDDVADIFQEAMVVLYEKAQKDDFRLSCKIGTYLFAICKHLWYKKLQKDQKAPDILSTDAGLDEGKDWAYEDDLNAHTERETHYQLLHDAMEQLGEPCSSLLKAFYHNDKSMQEIAAEFGYTNPDNAKTQKYKCLTRLRKIFYVAKAKW
ncbi:MAG: sigma-70 family RNA polymerase sigma factor [Bacteroidetes bacterium]|nr:sigma-70 family RNA polymerase sigma factor [Bacteroidota bacterium]MBS1739513.1 sigma-70 family RNA polymerase sigma factor [Bacteroidota bacterium]MBS1777414.1 sigma-70 family RNA polymerase sigma factor [Bacteroidota bacterium]